MNSSKTQKAQARVLRKHVYSWINIDVFNISIPIMTSEAACEAVCISEKLDWEPTTNAVLGYAGWGQDPDGRRLLYVMLPPESTPALWVHEASHLVDFIIDYLGLDPGIQGTETRAYLLGHIYASIEAVMTPFLSLTSEALTHEHTSPACSATQHAVVQLRSRAR